MVDKCGFAVAFGCAMKNAFHHRDTEDTENTSVPSVPLW